MSSVNKFRAWHNEAQQMLLPEKTSYLFKWVEEGQDIEVMQYALKKDIRGAEIYEGDILSDRWKVVVFKAKSGAFQVRFTINPKVNKPMTLIQWFSKRTRAGTIDIDGEVIGNIYQTPNLLKK